MKILFVCMQYIHSVRWINQLKGVGHDIFVFDCLDRPIHEDLKWTNYTENWCQRKLPYIKGEYWLEKNVPLLFNKIEPFLKLTASQKLKELIQEIKPDLVHSLEMQSETYPLLNVRRDLNFKWAYSCWGNDIYFFKDLRIHNKKIANCLSLIDYCFLECTRDEKLITSINTNSEILGTTFPGGGGYYLDDYKKYCLEPQKRKLILIKGYEHLFGRALNILSALELIPELLKDYSIYVYSAHNTVVEKIKEINKKYNLSIEYSSRYNQITHDELLEKFGKAKIAIGNNVSDGIPNTLLEALISGAFPIQSNPGGASEDYIENGVNGFLINDPESIEEIVNHITKAIKNSDLINKAFEINQQKAKELEYSKVKKKVLNTYKQIEKEL
jgi:glycosyltransferase involved in cell wall biosynthesis